MVVRVHQEVNLLIYIYIYIKNKVMLDYTDIIINDKPIQVKKGLTIIQVCEDIGIQLPRFCYHEQLSIAGNCRMCLVEIDKSLKPIASCAITVDKGMKIYTNTILVKKAREGIMEFLLINHPLDCPICDQGGECDLQDQAMLFGNDRGRFYEIKRSVSELYLGFFIKTVMTRCIHCTRCIRFLSELGGITQLGTTGRGVKTEIGNYIKKNILSEVSGNIIDLCPVGALTSKPYAFTARPWELTKIESIDLLDSMGSNIVYSLYGNKIMRILPLIHIGINDEWIDDKTRFSYDGFIIQRIIVPLVKNNNNFNKVSWNYILKLLNKLLFNKIGIILNNDISLETTYILKLYNYNIKKINIFIENSLVKRDIDFRYTYLFNRGYAGLANNDLFFIIGCNLKKELPLLLIKLRKEKRKKDISVIVFASIENYNLNEFNFGYKTENLLKFLEGKHYICSLFKRKKTPIIFLGNSILNSINVNGFIYLISKLKNLINNFFNGLCCIEQGAGINNLYELGINNKLYTKKITKYDIYLNINNFKTIFSNYTKMNILLSSHGLDNLYDYNIILPITTNIEKNGFYINGEGRLQESKLVQVPNIKSKEDWKALLEVYDILFQKNINNNINNLKDIRTKINYLCNFNLNIIGYSNFYKISNRKYKIYNLNVLPSILNLYDNKLVTKYSRLLLKFRQNFIKNNYN